MLVINVHFIKKANLLAVGDTTYTCLFFFSTSQNQRTSKEARFVSSSLPSLGACCLIAESLGESEATDGKQVRPNALKSPLLHVWNIFTHIYHALSQM